MKSTSFAVLLAIAYAQESRAVPLPFKNCGKHTDLFAISQVDIARNPRGLGSQGFPVYTQATFDPATGELAKLRTAFLGLDLVYELDHPFRDQDQDQDQDHDRDDFHRARETRETRETGRNVDGFVALPDSWLTSLSPAMPVTTTDLAGLPANVPWVSALPLSEGPKNFFNMALTGSPFAGTSIRGNLAQPITGANAHVSLSFNGRSGFPVPPVPGQYAVSFTTSTTGGAEIACLDYSLPNGPAVSVEPVPFRQLAVRPLFGARFLEAHWSYGAAHGRALDSRAMAPELEIQVCDGSAPAQNADELFHSFYDPFRRQWEAFVRTDKLAAGCYNVTVMSRLTGQIDGSAQVQIP